MKKAGLMLFLIIISFIFLTNCKKNTAPAADPAPVFGHNSPRPQCSCTVTDGRTDMVAPVTVDTTNWGTPQKVSAPVNTNCPEDAIEISRDGTTLYFMWTKDLQKNLSVDEQLNGTAGTYYATRTGGPGEFSYPKYYYLRKGAVTGSFDCELSFSPTGDKVYFHSLRLDNTGFQAVPTVTDVLDIYVSTVTGGVPGPGVNLGNTINSVYLDGEHCISPDGTTLYFASNRPGGYGDADIYYSTWTGVSWTTAVNMGAVINTADEEKMAAFAANDPDTMYFTSDRGSIGTAIYRSTRSGGVWGAPVLVLQGQVGEPTLTADGSIMYFVHVLTDAAPDPVFGADIYYVLKK